jgi:hypothetical protein
MLWVNTWVPLEFSDHYELTTFFCMNNFPLDTLDTFGSLFLLMVKSKNWNFLISLLGVVTDRASGDQ